MSKRWPRCKSIIGSCNNLARRNIATYQVRYINAHRPDMAGPWFPVCKECIEKYDKHEVLPIKISLPKKSKVIDISYDLEYT